MLNSNSSAGYPKNYFPFLMNGKYRPRGAFGEIKLVSQGVQRSAKGAEAYYQPSSVPCTPFLLNLGRHCLYWYAHPAR
jgi:hypothetical protein